jgi:hypothetical protein
MAPISVPIGFPARGYAGIWRPLPSLLGALHLELVVTQCDEHNTRVLKVLSPGHVCRQKNTRTHLRRKG